MRRLLCACVAFMVTFGSLCAQSSAGTTGGITGTVLDAATHAPLVNVVVTVESPSQVATSVTDASGNYRFLSLGPDVYAISFKKNGYGTVTQSSVIVFADEVQDLNVSLTAGSAVGPVGLRGSSTSDLVKHGSSSDVYSVSAAGQAASASLVGPGGLNSAYSAMAAIPGVQVNLDQMGYYQETRIRGGDIDQVGWEVDGVPVNSIYDNSPNHILSSLGQQELQVYTGGTPASADAQGIAGYVNQVIKTGTYPGFATVNSAVGGPAYYHKISLEFGGATPSRNFTYYVGLGGANQDFRYIDNSNGAGQPDSFFYPVNALPGANGVVYDGTASPANTAFTTGTGYGIANEAQRDSVVNLHYALRRNDGIAPDDIQLLYQTDELFTQFFSSQNDLGPKITSLLNGPLTWNDTYVYTGPMMKPFDPSKVTTSEYPSSPAHAFGAALPANLRDTGDNGFALTKLQYQHNFNANSFLRAYAYQSYANYILWGPNSASLPFYGASLADYERPDHVFGGNISFTDQLNGKHLLTLTSSVTRSNIQRYVAVNYQSNPANIPFTTLVDASGNCVDLSGAQVACYGSSVQHGTAANGEPAPAPAGAQWLVTENGIHANLNRAHTDFSAVSANDQWRPFDRLTLDLGVRAENFTYLLGDTGASDPARQFWFTHYNQEYCFGPGLSAPVFAGLNACPNGTVHTQLSNQSDSVLSATRIQPRFGFSYDIDPNTVVRGSYGIYARPQNTSWISYDTVQEDLASYLGFHFSQYGFTTPVHALRPDTSNNADISLERQLPGTDWSFKVTPYYRSTRDQLQSFIIDSAGLASGLNVGHQTSYGVELAVHKGDFQRQGLSGQFSYTFNRSRIRYNNFDNTNRNVIDNLNDSISQYNALTTGAKCYTPASASGPGTPDPSCAAGDISNPYFGLPAQPLLDRNGSYTTYNFVPGPIQEATGFETPHIASLILNYRHKAFAVTPSFIYSSGASYGSPLVWPGYLPQSCSGLLSSGKADPVTCNGTPVFLPDPYTGKFDNLGDFKQPWRFSAHVMLSYDVTKNVTAQFALTNLVDHCGQRGYPWDAPNVCVYGTLSPNFLAPAGNFYPNSVAAAPPPQLKYPYGAFYNDNNTGFLGTTMPLEFSFNVQIKM